MRLLNSPIILLVLFLCSCSKESVNTDSNPDDPQNIKPNILLIIADDMGLDATPGYDIGDVKPNVPNIQNMINSGVRFSNLWSYPTCTPTRSSILTGKYGFRTGVMKVDDELSLSETSLQKFLDNNNTGYDHAVVGKWHVSKTASHPTQLGVGYYAGLLTGGVQSYTNWNLTENGVTNGSNEYTTTKFTDLAINWVKDRENPWFLWLAYNAPHTPFHLPPSNLHTKGDLPNDQASIDANPQPYYMAMIEAMDTEIGRLLNTLPQEERDNTIIIFIGDNGTPGGVVQEYRTTRAKGSVYQGGVNVPMIISGKGVGRFNEMDNSLLNTSDLFATIAEIAGVSVSRINDSYSFKDLLNSNSSSNPRDFAYTEQSKSTGGEEYTIRNATHKYILFVDGEEALFDLNADYLEKTNLLNANTNAANQQQLNTLKQQLTDLKQ
ncbi:sulfatase-like hydrolase/transferase [Tenacibaculum sp. 190524A05c]|uniref:sulfatase-like hydrolase/transferase n=1 Tax=Tenacibaculum platacis TaxID=3137852 RepID=UPI0032B17640